MTTCARRSSPTPGRRRLLADGLAGERRRAHGRASSIHVRQTGVPDRYRDGAEIEKGPPLLLGYFAAPETSLALKTRDKAMDHQTEYFAPAAFRNRTVSVPSRQIRPPQPSQYRTSRVSIWSRPSHFPGGDVWWMRCSEEVVDDDDGDPDDMYVRSEAESVNRHADRDAVIQRVADAISGNTRTQCRG
jgi:hypothetical protein